MELNNLELVLPLLNFNSEDDFYFLQILQRKKDNPGIGSNSRVIKNYYIYSEKYLLDRFEEIKTLCKVFNARASLRLNKRSFKKVGFQTLETIANKMKSDDFKCLNTSFDRACGLTHNDSNKKWIVDVDKEDLIWIPQIIDAIQPCRPTGNKIITRIPSLSGVHLITSPFDISEFKVNFTKELESYSMSYIEIDIHKDNPVNLYYCYG